LVEALDKAGVEVLFDDRPKVSPGVKFKDAVLLGMPFCAILGRSFKDGIIELRIRGGETLEVPADYIVEELVESLSFHGGVHKPAVLMKFFRDGVSCFNVFSTRQH